MLEASVASNLFCDPHIRTVCRNSFSLALYNQMNRSDWSLSFFTRKLISAHRIRTISLISFPLVKTNLKNRKYSKVLSVNIYFGGQNKNLRLLLQYFCFEYKSAEFLISTGTDVIIDESSISSSSQTNGNWIFSCTKATIERKSFQTSLCLVAFDFK